MVALQVLLLFGCGASTRQKFDAWSRRVLAYQFSVGVWQADADKLLADYSLLQRHPAFPSMERKFQETRARVMVEGVQQEAPRITEMLQNMSVDELLVLRTTLTLGERYNDLKLRGQLLETERLVLRVEQQALELEAQRRASTLQTLGTLATLQQALKASSPVNCTTQYLGGMAFTNCR
jgi:hypothetical protein